MRTSQTLWTRERLENEGIEWIYELAQLMWRRSGHVTDISRECAVVVNGGPDIVPLTGLTTDDVESVEVYRVYPKEMATVAAASPRSPNGRGGQFVQPRNTYNAQRQNAGRACMAMYVWLR